jgi:hemerythrin-like domain-containing protein
MNGHTTPLDAPADTQMMGIVHSALRRDFVRIGMVLGTSQAAEPARRTALARHVLWLMKFLHDHHRGEDDGLYPLVKRRNPASADLAERMDTEHNAISPAMAALTSAAKHHLADPASPDSALQRAVDQLCGVLLPHLEREEQEMMPMVSASITEAEWRAWDQQYNLKPKGLTALAEQAHWVLDGLDEKSGEHVRHLVPPVPRFILIRLLGRRYRRKRTELWGGTRAVDVPSLLVRSVSPQRTGSPMGTVGRWPSKSTAE